jgi:hypothetical protein
MLELQEEGRKMKRFISTLSMVAILAAMIPMFAQTATAQNDCVYDNKGRLLYCTDGNGNVYDRHRNIINVGIGTGAGALIGGLLGGKKGALVGAAIGAGGAALYTYKINPKNKRYPRYYRR